MLKKINNFMKKNSKTNNNLKLAILSLGAMLQIVTPSFAGLCGSKPVAPAGERRASEASAITRRHRSSGNLDRILAGLDAYARSQQEIRRGFLLGIQHGRETAAVAPAAVPVPVAAPADADENGAA